MKIHWRRYFCNLACLNKRSLLVRLPPRVSIITNKNVCIRWAPCRPGGEQRPPLAGQDHVTRLASFSLSNRQRIAVSVEVHAPQVMPLDKWLANKGQPEPTPVIDLDPSTDE